MAGLRRAIRAPQTCHRKGLCLALLLHASNGLQFANTQPSADKHGLPPLPGGAFLELEAPGWTRGVGTGGRVWPCAGALCRYLARTDAVRGRRVVELGCGTGAVGCFAAALGATSVALTEGGSDALRRIAAKNVAANADLFATENVTVAPLSWGAAFDGAADVVVGSDVTYDRDSHDRLCATLASLLAPEGSVALLAHQHRRFASVLSGGSQLDHFLDAARDAGLDVDEAHVDASANALAPVTILRVAR